MASKKELQDLSNEAAALRERLTEVATMAGRGAITLSQLEIMTSQIRNSLAATEARLDALGSDAHRRLAPNGWPDTSMNSPAGREWAAMDIDTRRDHVRSMLNVVLFPHHSGFPRVFDPMTVLVRIKQPGDARGPLTRDQIIQARKEDGRGFFLGAASVL